MIIVQDNLTSELQDALEMCRRKDQDLGRLAEEVGATRAQELALQAQYTSELQQIAKLRDAEVDQKEDEVGVVFVCGTIIANVPLCKYEPLR